MKYELQTIPVWKAFEAGPECALCDLEAESEARNVEFFLGNSIMAPEMRVRLNEHGFCRRHFHLLASGTGKLGYSLALGTHIDSLRERMRRLGGRLAAGRGGKARKAVAELVSALRAQEDDCLMCDRIRYNMANFSYTIARLYADEPEFRALLVGSRGFCLHHLPGLLEVAAEILTERDLPAWHEAILELEDRALDTARQRLEEFSWQFDYQREKRTPAEAMDAVPRAVRRLSGRV